MKILCWFCLAISTVYFCSCNLLDDHSKEAETAKLLNKPPFTVLTDSISQFPDNGRLYLRRAELLSQKKIIMCSHLRITKKHGN